MSRSNIDRKGRHIARLFRQARELPDGRRCDLEPILEEDDIEVVESDCADPGYTACLLRPEDGCAGIVLAPYQDRGRRRFSIAHELAHFHIPAHRKRPPGWCGDDAMVSGPDAGHAFEWQANDFAAELLMPTHRFLGDTRRREPSFLAVRALASPDVYDVSVTAAALRWVQVTEEGCALVCARGGIIEWVAKSSSFRHRIPWRGDTVPPHSGAASVFSGRETDGSAHQCDPSVWLELEQRRPVELFESTHAIPNQDQVLSLLWVIPCDDDNF